jgi:hypothetical protein
MRVTLQDYSDILFTGYTYQLPENVSNIIKNLTKELGVVIAAAAAAVSHKPEEEFKRSTMHYGNKRGRSELRNKMVTNDATWKTAPPFKTTKIEKKEGTQQVMNEIRVCLNKISNKNYEQQRDAIFKCIDQVILQDNVETNTDEQIKMVAQSIFDIASSNKFYSELYAMLYKELIDKYDLFRDHITHMINDYYVGIDTIEFVDSNEDYDRYCENNKLNDKRKAMSTFIVNLMKKDILPKCEVLDLTHKLLEKVAGLVDTDDNVNLVDEITENLFIIITLVIDDGNSHKEDLMSPIAGAVRLFSKYKVKEHKSISSRAIFKYMDIAAKLDSL